MFYMPFTEYPNVDDYDLQQIDAYSTSQYLIGISANAQIKQDRIRIDYYKKATNNVIQSSLFVKMLFVKKGIYL